MSRALYVACGPVALAHLPAWETRLAQLGAADGLVLLDPGDAVHPLHLAHLARRRHPEWAVVLPLVARDANRRALLGLARAGQALGCRGCLLLSGHLAPNDPAPAVYDLDPQQLVSYLRDGGVEGELWVASRWASPAQRERSQALLAAGASRVLVPWRPGLADRAELPGLPELAAAAVGHLGPEGWQGGDASGGLPPQLDLVLEFDAASPAQPGEALARLRGVRS